MILITEFIKKKKKKKKNNNNNNNNKTRESIQKKTNVHFVLFWILKSYASISRHANSSRLFCKIIRRPFTQHSCVCQENFHESQTSHEGS